MVIGEQFAWGHLPKTGGQATRAMFRVFAELIVFADPAGFEQYTTFRERENEVRGKLLALNLRRLPAWILSHENHKARIPALPHPKPNPISSPEQMASSKLPDECLSIFTDGGRLQIGTWVRTEFAADDLLELASRFTDVTPEQRRLVHGIEIDELDYDHDTRHWFSEKRLERLYAGNPSWAAIEREVYGDTMLDMGS